MALRYMTKKKKAAIKEANGEFVHSIYDRGKELLPPEYLVRHQAQTEAEATSQLAHAAERRQRRNEKRLASLSRWKQARQLVEAL